MKFFIEVAIEAVETKFEDLKAIRRKRQDRVLKSYSDANDKILPNEDANGRLHAPCDGYEDIDGRGVYGKGEFLPIPESVFEQLEMEGITCNRGQKEYGQKTRLLVEDSEGEEIAMMFRSFGLGCSFGKTFDRGGVAMKYMYIGGNDAMVKAIEAAIVEAKEKVKSERRDLKGEAPEGKLTVEGKIVFIKRFVPMSVYDYGSDKMLVELENKSTVYGTLPKCISDAEIGDFVKFSATFEVARDDKTHAFFKRPSVK